MIQKILKDDFVKHNIILFSGSMIVAVLNYAYHPILSRMMSVGDFGEVQALIAIFLQSGVLLGIFGTIVVNLTANSNSDSENLSLINQLYKIAMITSLVLTVGIIIGTPFLKKFLQFHSVWAFWVLALSLPLSVSLTFRRFFLQGKKEFLKNSLVSIFYAGGRLVIAVFLVWLGWATVGAIGAITLTTFFSLFYAYKITHKELKLSLREKVVFNKKLKEEFRYGILIFLVTAFVTFLYTADMIFVKHYFSPEIAGFYGGVATIARIVYFITGSVVGVLIASVKIKDSWQENKRVLLKGLIIISLIGASVTGIFILFPELVIKLMIGQRYVSYAYLLPRMAILLFLVSLSNLLLMFFLALRKYFIIKIVIIGALFITLTTVLHHATLISIVDNFLVGSVGVIGWLGYKVRKVNPTSLKLRGTRSP